MTESVRFPGSMGDEVSAQLALPALARASAPAVVLVHGAERCEGAEGAGARKSGLLERCVESGFVVLAPDLTARRGSEAGVAFADRPATADLDAAAAFLAARDDVDDEQIAIIGLGAGGTLAFLSGCHSRRIAAVVALGGEIRYADLSGDRPVQPLEMALNLSSPYLGIFAEGDPQAPAEDVDALERTLDQFAKSAEIRRVPGPGSEASAGDHWPGVYAFLAESLGLCGDEERD